MPNEPADSSLETRGEERAERLVRAFVIDNDPLMAGLLQRRLARRGVEAVSFADADRLLAELATSSPELLCTDLEMPRVRGTDLIRAARARGFGGTIVLVTASRDRAEIASALASGADDVLSKPLQDFELDCLVEKVRRRGRGSAPTLEGLCAILGPMSQGAIVLDDECLALFANKRAYEILDAESAEEIADIVERGGIADEIFKRREEGSAIAFVDLGRLGGKKRNPVGFEIHRLTPPVSGAAHLVLIHDFSEWRKLDELHSRFATYLSHRMRTPLTSVRNAVKILSEQGVTLDMAEKERFLDIGCRNVEKLIDSFNEIQKIFMVESGEINACRSLVRIGAELRSILGECAREGAIEGFKLRSPERSVFTSRASLRGYCRNAVDALSRWLASPPYLECSVVVSDACGEAGARAPMVSISFVPRCRGGDARMPMRSFLESREAPRRLVLERLADAMDGTFAATDRNALLLRIPAEPAFDRDRDLVHPLHVMLERAELAKLELHLVSARMAGEVPERERFARLLERCLCTLPDGDDVLVARGEEPFSFNVFVVGASRDRVRESMESVRDRFVRSCRARGEERYPSIAWETRYCREPGSSCEADASSLLGSLA